jgi:hypothetical protein
MNRDADCAGPRARRGVRNRKDLSVCHLGKLAAGAEPSQTGCALPLWHWQAAAAVALVLYRWTLDCTSTCRNCSVIVVLLRRLYRSTLHFSNPVRFKIFTKNKCIFNDDITSSSCLFSFYLLLKYNKHTIIDI